MSTIPTNIAKRYPEISQAKLFQGLELKEVSSLLASSKIYKFNHKKTLLRQDETATHLCIILSGNVQTYRSHKDGREIVIRIANQYESLFENIIFSDLPSPVHGEVIKHAEILMIPSESVKKLAKTYAPFALNLAKVLAYQTNQSIFQQELIALHSAKERLGAFFLSTMLEQQPCGNAFTLNLEKSLIARHLAMTPETFSRTLKDLQPMGITVTGNTITLKKTGDLCKFYDSFLAYKCSKHDTPDCPHYHAEHST